MVVPAETLVATVNKINSDIYAGINKEYLADGQAPMTKIETSPYYAAPLPSIPWVLAEDLNSNNFDVIFFSYINLIEKLNLEFTYLYSDQMFCVMGNNHK